ncbi:response regulator transcription factor [Adlercreutzia mucosicola]|uniref:response regulator transcription factor n=1 Tax=Adlercreutzia mucosicola TaxID=580026 RepID=UPI0003F5B1F6|nr:response regulator transcription factor [Adlercreutzia mucosicola]MCR2034433.1 response regulator transcription factor [Adlercreutzia mucosicola]MEB1813804.1 response regulator transcription factor [Adlercreutzia mucosicola]
MVAGARILVVEDDAAINRVVCSYLEKAGAMCTAAFSGTEGLMHLAGGATFDLIVTDLMLPGASGEEVVADARGRGVPAIVLSARATVADRVDLLRIGADDYLTKPFDLEELLARCEAVLRRSASTARAASVPSPSAGAVAPPLRFGAWELDGAARRFTAAGIPVRLTRTEYEIVRALMAEPRRVHTKRSLSAAAAGDEVALEDKTVATHIGNVRAKLRPTGTEDYLETVWGVGFKLRDGV